MCAIPHECVGEYIKIRTYVPASPHSSPPLPGGSYKSHKLSRLPFGHAHTRPMLNDHGSFKRAHTHTEPPSPSPAVAAAAAAAAEASAVYIAGINNEFHSELTMQPPV